MNTWDFYMGDWSRIVWWAGAIRGVDGGVAMEFVGTLLRGLLVSVI